MCNKAAKFEHVYLASTLYRKRGNLNYLEITVT